MPCVATQANYRTPVQRGLGAWAKEEKGLYLDGNKFVSGLSATYDGHHFVVCALMCASKPAHMKCSCILLFGLPCVCVFIVSESGYADALAGNLCSKLSVL